MTARRARGRAVAGKRVGGARPRAGGGTSVRRARKGAQEGEAGRGAPAAPDVEGMRRAISLFLSAAGVPLAPADRARTPVRVAEAWAEDLIGGYALDPASEMTWEAAPRGEGLVALRDILFHSTCVHHLLGFHGRAHVAYLPDRRMAGLSKIARLVEILSRRLQVQERLTEGIVDVLVRTLRPAGAACIVEAEHMCIACRGVRRPGVKVVTSRFHGRLASGPRRAEVVRLLGQSPERGR